MALTGKGWIDPDNEPTPVLGHVHEPIGHTVRHLRRQIHVALGLNAVALIGLAFLVYWQTIVMGDWRRTGREISTEILERVRALESGDGSCCSNDKKN